jgi:hypothetical protein
MSRLTSRASSVIAFCALCIVGAIDATPAVAQIRAALVQNVDEPGRNPYQETQFTICGGPQNCNFTFAFVPSGKRLVLTHVSGFVDVKGGTIPNSNVESNFGGNQFATVFFLGARGTVSPSSTRIVYNSDVLAYFGPGEQPFGFYGLFSTSDTFLSGGVLTLSGYYINLP